MNDHHLAPEDLHQKVQLLTFALTAAGIGTWSLDPIHETVVWDERCRELFGFAEDEHVRYAQVFDYIYADDRHIVRKNVLQALDMRSGGQYDLEYRTQSPSGQIRWVHCKGKAYFNESGQAYLFAGTAQDVTENMALRLKESVALQHSRLALESAEAGSFKVDVATGKLEYSSILRKIFTGSDTGEVTREQLVDAIYPDDRIIRDMAYEVALQTGRLEYEARTVWRDGSVHWIKVTGAYEYDKQGRPVVLAGIAVDSTESKNASLVIEDSEVRFRSLIEQAPIATSLFTGKDMIITVANAMMIGYWGKGASIIGKPLVEALPEMKDQPFPVLLNEVYTTGIAYETKSSRVDLVVDGVMGTYYFDFIYKPVYNSAGEIYGVMDMAVDVTDQVLLKHKADESQAALYSAINVANLDVWEIDTVTRTLLYSDRFREWIGSSGNTCDLEFFYGAMEEGDRAKVREVFSRALALDTPYDVEYTLLNARTGRKRILHAQARAVPDGGSRPTRLIGITQDITEQRSTTLALEQQVQVRTEELAASNEELMAINEEVAEANQNLQRSNQELEQFAYITSHDLQEPLRKIKTFTNLLMDHADAVNPEGAALVVKINRSAERMTLLIRDLLDFSRLQVPTKSFAEVNLVSIIQAVIDDFELVIGNEKAIVRVGDLPTIQGVSTQLNQLFYNLLSNALKFKARDAQPMVEINSRLLNAGAVAEIMGEAVTADTYYDITISDEGIGMEAQYLQQIFEIFKRLHGNAEFPGSGMGLAICKRIVSNHNGYIFVESETGKGSTFHVILPAHQRQE
jgi:PAS domain S-box-containing protein